MEESFWVSNRFGEKLEALLRKPDGDSKFPAVLFVPGLGMTLHEWNNSFDEIAKALVVAGYLTLQFQFNIFYPDGSVRELPLTKRAGEFEDACQWLVSRKEVDSARVGILAQSFGVPTVLSADLSPFKTLVFVSGSYFPLRSIPKVYEERGVKIDYSGDTMLPRSSGEKTTVGKEFWPSLASFDPTVRVQQLTQPVLFIHGDQDTKIPVSDVEKVFAAIASTQKKLKIFQGGDHGITDVPRPMREEFLQDVITWFKKTL